MSQPIRLVPTALAAALLLALAAPVHAQPQNGSSFAEPPARVVGVPPGRAIAQAAPGSRAVAVGAAMRGRGADDAAAQSLVEVGGGTARTGITHLRMEQQVGGVTVYGSSVKAAFNGRGELVHLIDKTAAVPAGAPRAATIDARRALDAAMARVHPDVRARFTAGDRNGATQRFAGGPFFHRDAEVTRVLVPQQDGSLAHGFLVETWTARGNLLDHTLVGGDGSVLAVERRTANDQYNVFAIDPGKGPQTIVAGPAVGNAQSPAGWLGSGAQTTLNINGNNASAYLDAVSDDKPDTGGSAVANGSFTTAADLTAQPSTAGNRAVAVQNLFYLNNVIHDRLYRHGFDEAAGNFQTANFGKGGRDGDPVDAEAQDGGGLDNANFATPVDGRRPRMQMYLWSGAGPNDEVIVGGSTYGAVGAGFGPALTTAGLSGALAVGVPVDGCAAMSNAVAGKVAIVDRGGCDFVTKVGNAQAAGATAVVVANNAATGIFAMGGTASPTIPSVMVSQADGAALKSVAGSAALLRRKAIQPLQLDGDLDADVVFHEYGHGLTSRMIGRMSGPLAGAIGEGASDVVAFMVNGDDVIGEYSSGDPLGIRRFRYAGYPLTYADVTGAEVHSDGEIYAGAMWRLRETWLASGRSNDQLFDHFVDGMNYTPAKPVFEDMRNGLLDSIAATAGADAVARCTLVWNAFAQSGIGVGASGKVAGNAVKITASTATRADCAH